MLIRSLVEGEFLKLSTSVVPQQEISPSSGPSVTQSRVLNLADGQGMSSIRAQANIPDSGGQEGGKTFCPWRRVRYHSSFLRVSLCKKPTASLQINTPCHVGRADAKSSYLRSYRKITQIQDSVLMKSKVLKYKYLQISNQSLSRSTSAKHDPST